MRIRLSVILIILLFGQSAEGQNVDINLLKKINPDTYTTGAHIARFESDITHPIAYALPVGLLVEGYFDKSEKREEKAFEVLSSVAAADAAAVGLKVLIQRPRPYVTYPQDVHPWGPGLSYSMPSGHSAESFALATSLSLAYPKWYVIVPAYAWAASVAYSRMVVGVHYPTDVLAGAVEGSAVAVGVYYLEQRYFKKHNFGFQLK